MNYKVNFKNAEFDDIMFTEEFKEFHRDHGEIAVWRTVVRDTSNQVNRFTDVINWLKHNLVGDYEIEEDGLSNSLDVTIFDADDAYTLYTQIEFNRQHHWFVHELMQCYKWYSCVVEGETDASVVENWCNKNIKVKPFDRRWRVIRAGSKLIVTNVDDVTKEKIKTAFTKELVTA